MKKLTPFLILAQLTFPFAAHAIDCNSTEATRLNPFAKGNLACTGAVNASKSKTTLSESTKQNIELLQGVLNVWSEVKYVNLDSLSDLDLKGTEEEKKQSILKFIELSAAYGTDSLNSVLTWTNKQGLSHPQENLLSQLASKSGNHHSSEGKATLTEVELQKLISKVPTQMQDSFMKGYLDRLTGGDILETDLKLTMKYKEYFSKSYLLNLVNQQIAIAEKTDYTKKYVSDLKSVIEFIGSDNNLNLDQICELAETVNNLTFSTETTKQIPDSIKDTFIKSISPHLVKIKKLKQQCDPNSYQVKIDQVLGRVEKMGFNPNEAIVQKSVVLTNLPSPENLNYNSCKFNEVKDDFLMSFINMTTAPNKMFMRTTTVGCTLSIQSSYSMARKTIAAEIKIYNSLNQKIFMQKQEYMSASDIIKSIQGMNYQANPYHMVIYSK